METGRAAPDAAREERCRRRLRSLRLPGEPSLAVLLRALERQEGRPVVLRHHGVDGHLVGWGAGVTGLVDRDPRSPFIRIDVADPLDSERGRFLTLHEIGHLVVEPRDGGGPVRSVLDDGDRRLPCPAAVALRCDRDDEVEREVELTAHLLAQLLYGPRPVRRSIDAPERSAMHRLLLPRWGRGAAR